MIDRGNGAVLLHRAVEPALRLAFSPDGEVRYETDAAGTGNSNVRAYSPAGSDVLLWQRTVSGNVESITAAPNDIALVTTIGGQREFTILVASDGSERARTALSVESVACCRDNALIVSATAPGPQGQPAGLSRLVAVNLATLAETVVYEEPNFPTVYGGVRVVLSSDGQMAYRYAYYLGIKFSLSYTSYSAIDLSTGERVAAATLGSFISDFDVQPGAPCRLTFPTSASIGPEGGFVQIPVTPIGPCDAWTATSSSAIANPGPHTGGETLRIAVLPTRYAVPAALDLFVLGRTIRVTQTGGPPASPEATGVIRDGRVVISWTLGIGAMPTEFVVRGGLRGEPRAALATVSSTTRTWMSDPVPPGSFALDVVARNYAGDGPPSNLVELSNNVGILPDPPIDLIADVADDIASLRWSPAPTGPAPEAYVVEAAALGGSAFIPVLRVEAPRADASRIPLGSWQARVRSVTAAGVSGPSNVVTFTSVRCTAPPSPPQRLRAITVAPFLVGQPTFTLRWERPELGSVDEYIIEASRAGLGTGSVRIALSGSTHVFETEVPYGSFFSARVRGRNACGQSDASNEVLLYTP